MMIRTTSLILLLACTSIGMAQPLYKWTETDGSVTFSPKQPPAGISFETIQSSAKKKPATELATLDAPATPVTAAATPADNRSSVAPRIVPNGDQFSSASSHSANNPSGQQLIGISAPAATDANPDSGQALNSNRVASIAASNKQSRCQDLRKRVVSLERRLKSRLTPEDMDNTVIHMARYQRSFDQYCEQ